MMDVNMNYSAARRGLSWVGSLEWLSNRWVLSKLMLKTTNKHWYDFKNNKQTLIWCDKHSDNKQTYKLGVTEEEASEDADMSEDVDAWGQSVMRNRRHSCNRLSLMEWMVKQSVTNIFKYLNIQIDWWWIFIRTYFRSNISRKIYSGIRLRPKIKNIQISRAG